MSETVISVRGLRKSYNGFEAVRGIDLEVNAGEVYAFLGPNGAGKTSTVEVLEGYRTRDAGEVSVLGEDPADAGRDWRERVGIVLQSCRLNPLLSVRESLELYAGYYREPRGVEETIELVGLGEKADARAGKLSGGQQRRLDVALALVGDPELLFLDEPTTGFDPGARRQAWEMIDNMRRLGKTVFLTTHYMEEAQALADRAAILAEGTIVAEGDPDELGGRAGARAVISFRAPADGGLPEPFASALDADRTHVSHPSADPLADLEKLLGWARSNGSELPGLEVRRPSLEDVYLELTERGEQ